MRGLGIIRRNNWLVTPLALLLLSATTAPALWRMDCLSSGKTSCAWISIAPCCHTDGQADQPRVTKHCCDYTHAQAVKYDATCEVRNVFSLAAMIGTFPMATAADAMPALVVAEVHGRPPPLSGRERLTGIRVLRI